jgi:hypothetical protein
MLFVQLANKRGLKKKVTGEVLTLVTLPEEQIPRD